jgi:hypothetical protein
MMELTSNLAGLSNEWCLKELLKSLRKRLNVTTICLLKVPTSKRKDHKQEPMSINARQKNHLSPI